MTKKPKWQKNFAKRLVAGKVLKTTQEAEKCRNLIKQNDHSIDQCLIREAVQQERTRLLEEIEKYWKVEKGNEEHYLLEDIKTIIG